MNISQRQIGLALIVVVTIGAFLTMAIGFAASRPISDNYATTIAFVASAALLVAYWRGWAFAGHAMVVMVTLVLGFALSPDKGVSTVNLAIIIPPVLAMIFASPLWVLGSALGVLSIILARQGTQSPYTDPATLILFAIIVVGLILSRIATDNARKLEEANARAEEARAHAERQSAELEQRAHELEQRNEQQQRLLDLVATLETPAVALAEGVLLAPVVGHIDTRRAQAITSRLLKEAAERHTRLVILDVSGVTEMDTCVAKALLNTSQALRLLGCQVTISGISASVAMTMTHLGIGLEGVSATRSPRRHSPRCRSRMMCSRRTNADPRRYLRSR
jgi:anti-anti-sigma factor